MPIWGSAMTDFAGSYNVGVTSEYCLLVTPGGVIGRQASEIALDLKGLDHVVCTTMVKAVELAAAEAEPGDTVLLAPGAASFDQYDNFEERGKDLTAAVAKVL